MLGEWISCTIAFSESIEDSSSQGRIWVSYKIGPPMVVLRSCLLSRWKTVFVSAQRRATLQLLNLIHVLLRQHSNPNTTITEKYDILTTTAKLDLFPTRLHTHSHLANIIRQRIGACCCTSNHQFYPTSATLCLSLIQKVLSNHHWNLLSQCFSIIVNIYYGLF